MFRSISVSLLALATPPALACGGFFCDSGPPGGATGPLVVQSGERILFSVDMPEEGEPARPARVTTVVEVRYAGPADDFSWVVPVPAVPKVSVGTPALFDLLDPRTATRFSWSWQTSFGCGTSFSCGGGGMDASDAFDGDDGGGGDPSGEPTKGDAHVQVLESGTEGPYDYTVLAADDADALTAWLDANGYTQPPEAGTLIHHYVVQHYTFVALKLSKGQDAGAVRPVVLEYDAPFLACIPLILTAVAADPDMPVTAWILGNARAVPINYFHVVVPDEAFPWDCVTGSSDGDACETFYTDTITKAVDVANGHAFVTEYAGSTNDVLPPLFPDNPNLDPVYASTSLVEFVNALVWAIGPLDASITATLGVLVPRAPDAPEDCDAASEFFSAIDKCETYVSAGWTFDAATLFDALDKAELAPRRAAKELFMGKPVLTRLFTTVSPDEMGKDPIFAFNPDLPNVRNLRAATLSPECSPDAARLDFSDGGTATYPAQYFECGAPVLSPAVEAAPSSPRIEVMTEHGGPEVVASADVLKREAALDLAVPTAVFSPEPRGGADGSPGGADGTDSPDGSGEGAGSDGDDQPAEASATDGNCASGGQGRPVAFAGVLMGFAVGVLFAMVRRPW